MIKKLKILIIIAFVLAALLCAVLFIINAIVKNKAKPYILSDDQTENDYDCILVLGCGVYGSRPSHMLEDRLKKSVELFAKKASSRLLMSGDNSSDDYNEVAVMRDFALGEGIAADVIFMDYAGFSTYESMYRAREIFGVKKVLIVTQGYHLYRAVYDARALGLDAYGAPADLRKYAGQALREVREVLARAKDFVWCMLKPEPTYLGEQVPIWGKGNASD